MNKSKKIVAAPQHIDNKTHINGAGSVVEMATNDMIKENYMPYAVAVINARAIPAIDGFKPAHRKLLYTMYKMGLMSGPNAKCAKIVGQTMQINPHGDSSIYETLVRLSRDNESLLCPFVASKGNFGKAYSKNMVAAASRYTEAKLEPICNELFCDIEKDTVNMVPNFDNTMVEPVLLPVTFPNVLTNDINGIAVAMTSRFCSFNLREICETTIELLKNPKFDITQTLLAPDLVGGGILLYDAEQIRKIYETGRGKFTVRAKYTFDKKNNCIEITEIPPGTTVEDIMNKIFEKINGGRLRPVTDVRDETDINGLKLTIDVRRGTDADELMKELYALTPLENDFSCFFNILTKDGYPKTLGVKDILLEWIDFRTGCIQRRTSFDLKKNSDKLHLLKGLEKILADIDRAVAIIRGTEKESAVVPNLMEGFDIDKIQAEYIAEIKLRHLNREYILKRTKDIKDLKKTIKKLESVLKSPEKVKQIISEELIENIKKYGKDRKTEIISIEEVDKYVPSKGTAADYPVRLFFTKEGYFKKITPQSLRMSSSHKLKENDEIIAAPESTNAQELLFFTDKCQVYKARVSDFSDTKASALGDYIPAFLKMEPGENVLYMTPAYGYKGYMMFFFENGKAAKVDMSAYETKTNRKKLIKAFSDKSGIVSIMYIEKDKDVVITSSAGKVLLTNTINIPVKTTKDTVGIAVMSLRKGYKVISVKDYKESEFVSPSRYRTKNLPAAGIKLSEKDMGEQLTLNTD